MKDISGLVFVDTSVWILAFKGQNKKISLLIDYLLKENRVAVSGIVTLELSYGVKNQKEFKELKEEMKSLVWLETDEKVWERAYSIAFQARRKGITVPSTDILIVALAIENNCALLHSDKHFDVLSKEGVGLDPKKNRSFLSDKTN
jgi:predicted nucleic acid-binding protein